MARKTLEPTDITAIVDTREQRPLDLAPLKTEVATLPTGDYSVKGLEHFVVVERKSLQDLIGVVGYGRDRFDREIQRLQSYPCRLIIVEGSMAQIALKQYRGNTEPMSVVGSLLGWMAHGIPILFTTDHTEAGRMAARFLFIAARRRWSEAQAFCDTLKIAD